MLSFENTKDYTAVGLHYFLARGSAVSGFKLRIFFSL